MRYVGRTQKLLEICGLIEYILIINDTFSFSTIVTGLALFSKNVFFYFFISNLKMQIITKK